MARQRDSDGKPPQLTYPTLSEICRLFVTPYDPNPCRKEGPMRLTFNHYRKSRFGQELADGRRDVSPCPISGCRMDLKSNDEWRAHLRLVHGISERVDLQKDSHDTQGTTRSHVGEHRNKSVSCRKYSKTESRIVECNDKFGKKQDFLSCEGKTVKAELHDEVTNRSEAFVKIEQDDDIFETSSPVIKEEPVTPEKTSRKDEQNDSKKNMLPMEIVVKEEPPSPPSEQIGWRNLKFEDRMIDFSSQFPTLSVFIRRIKCLYTI
ncbi:unnamed protein product [Strongylus vulgaris]|uniref:Uncharacterized protein n=1 Tax=Strongylus vulgaris TaxID=40348 RepID=A0A3P7J7P2_STRVU|nr:unnamed protein product [Strongylus vulgaris]